MFSYTTIRKYMAYYLFKTAAAVNCIVTIVINLQPLCYGPLIRMWWTLIIMKTIGKNMESSA